jgi:hypothetical protein
MRTSKEEGARGVLGSEVTEREKGRERERGRIRRQRIS